jgi:hypothetical protein
MFEAPLAGGCSVRDWTAPGAKIPPVLFNCGRGIALRKLPARKGVTGGKKVSYVDVCRLLCFAAMLTRIMGAGHEHGADTLQEEAPRRINSMAYSICPGGKISIPAPPAVHQTVIHPCSDDEGEGSSACTTKVSTPRSIAMHHVQPGGHEASAERPHMLGIHKPHAGGEAALDEDDFQSLLMAVDGNHRCADCGDDTRVTWASWVVGRGGEAGEELASSGGHGIVLCSECCGGHRSLGVHISQPHSIKMDIWGHDLQLRMLTTGNTRSNAYYEHLPSHLEHKPLPSASIEDKHEFIRWKYAERVWCETGTGEPSRESSRLHSARVPQQVHAGICIVKVLRGRSLPTGSGDLFVELTHSSKCAGTAARKIVKASHEVAWEETLRLNIGVDSVSLPVGVALRSKSKKGIKGVLATGNLVLDEKMCNELEKRTVSLGGASEIDLEVLWCPLDA